MIKKRKSLGQEALKIDFCTVSIQFPLQGPQGPLLSSSNPRTATGGGFNKGLFDITPPSVSGERSLPLYLTHAPLLPLFLRFSFFGGFF